MPAHLSWILAEAPAKKSGGGGFLFIVLIAVVGMVYLFSRSQKNARKRAAAVQSSIGVGERVMTTAGIHATVVGTNDSTVDLEIADGVIVTFAKGAVTRVLTETEQADADADEYNEPEDADDEYDDGAEDGAEEADVQAHVDPDEAPADATPRSSSET